MQRVRTFITHQRDALFLAGLSFLLAAVTVVWLRLNALPPQWDDALYLAKSLVMFDALVDGGLAGYARRFFTILDWKPPLITVLPTPFYLTLGRNSAHAFAVNLVLIPVLLVSVYLLGKRCWNARAGLLAASITATIPMVYGLARWYLVEFILTALVSAGVLLLLESRGFRNERVALGVGIVCGLGLLLKVLFPLYFIGPFLFVFAGFLFRHKVQSEDEPHPPSRLGILVRLALPALVLAMPWYLFNFRRVSQLVLVAGFSSEADIYGTGPVLSWTALKTYLIHVVDTGPSAYYTALAVLSFAWIALTGKLRVFLRRLPREPRVVLALWAAPFLVFLFARNKNVRFVAPLLPVFALGLAFALDFATERLLRWRTAFLALALAFPVVNLFHVSFGILGNAQMALGEFNLLASRLDYAARFDRAVWPLREMMETFYGSARFHPGEKKLVMAGSDRASFNADNLGLASVESRLPFEIVTSAYETDPPALLRQVDSASFFVYKEGGEPESSAYNIYQAALIRHVCESGRFVEIPYGRKLPDGGVARLYKNLSTKLYTQRGAFVPAHLNPATGGSVRFGDQIELRGFVVEQTTNSLQVSYRWALIQRVSREYWCFTHVLSPSGAIVAFLDHPILDGDPPIRSWKEGDEAREELRIELPSLPRGERYRLRVGLFHEPTGERLPVSSSVPSEGMKFSVADHGTAVFVEFHEPSTPLRPGRERPCRQPQGPRRLAPRP